MQCNAMHCNAIRKDEITFKQGVYFILNSQGKYGTIGNETDEENIIILMLFNHKLSVAGLNSR